MEMITNETRKARKDYHCEGCEQIGFHNDTAENGNPPKCEGIKRGQQYQYQFNKESGEAYVWRSCLPCFQFICEHGLYEDA